MRLKTGNKRAKKKHDHIREYGYGYAFGGGIGSYSFCRKCGVFMGKIIDEYN